MKRLILTAIALVMFVITYSQAPQKFNYQAIARNNVGVELANQPIGLRVSIIDGSPNGTVLYQETHINTTNQFGLFNLSVGAGSVVTGSFSSISWGIGSKYIKTEIDPNGGTSYTVAGTSELLSVPYALYAQTSSVAGPTGPQGSTGLNGATGPTGANGNTGATGSQGVQGATGANGINGSAGATGPTGANGLNGNTGTQGPTGSQGPTGPTGANGLNGINGTTGATGAQGPTGSNGGFSHYIGEQFGGGVIYHLWKDSQGVEHGLIVDKTDFGLYWSDVNGDLIGSTAQSSWDGLSNSNAIVAQPGHTNSAAATCLNSINGGQNDWYLPSIDELILLWNNRFNVNKSLSSINGATVLPKEGRYWSSTEFNSQYAWCFNFAYGYAVTDFFKSSGFSVRAIRAF